MEKRKITSYLQRICRQIRRDKRAFTVCVILYITILIVIIYNAIYGKWTHVFTGVLAAFLLLLPPVVEERFRIDLPTTLEIFAYLFVFCAEILGEICNFYVRFAFWDMMLHTANGFIFAAVGFGLSDILNAKKDIRAVLSPRFLATVAFCFSMTVGVLWEFFEFGMDWLFYTDMQKDTFVYTVNTVSLPNDMGEKVTHITDIVSSAVILEGGDIITFSGYLDIGLFDTMRDLFLNMIGALLFAVIGFFYVRSRGKGGIADRFIPVLIGEEKEDGE